MYLYIYTHTHTNIYVYCNIYKTQFYYKLFLKPWLRHSRVWNVANLIITFITCYVYVE